MVEEPRKVYLDQIKRVSVFTFKECPPCKDKKFLAWISCLSNFAIAMGFTVQIFSGSVMEGTEPELPKGELAYPLTRCFLKDGSVETYYGEMSIDFVLVKTQGVESTLLQVLGDS